MGAQWGLHVHSAVGTGARAFDGRCRMPDTMSKRVTAGVLSVAYEESGAPNSVPVVLLHGFPYDVHAYSEVTPALVTRNIS
jgi:hypothetical protein